MLRERFHEYGLFVGQYLRNFRSTGAVLPSGRRLAAALSRYVGGSDGRGQRILEVGPGTGAVTRRIAQRMGPADQLDLVELNDVFVARLRKALAEEPVFGPIAPRTRLIHGPVEELAGEGIYDVIISGLPLNNFTAREVEQILSKLAGLLKADGTLSFFEYIGLRHARTLVSGRAERARLRGIGKALAAVLGPYEIRRDWVWPNVPPAWVHHVRFSKSPRS
jgi:phosphatidylethanolamine/phosphatidyl-N-methylethanolamine N-methyltransferase